jgi:pilus assembly protein CpaC
MRPMPVTTLTRHCRSAAVVLAAAALMTASASSRGADAPAEQVPAATQPIDLQPLIDRGLDPNGTTITLTVGQSRRITTSVPYSTVDVTDPEVVGAKLIGTKANEILLTARHAGSSQLMLWDDAGRNVTVEIVVEPDLRAIRAELARDFHDLKIQVGSANGAVVLTGRVPSAELADKAVQVATPFSGKVINLLEIGGGQQVTLQVRFAEVSRDAVRSLGVNFGVAGSGGFGSSIIGGVGPLSIASTGTSGLPTLSVGAPGSNVTAFGQFTVGKTPFDLFVTALKENNLMRTLAEPNLTVMSGSQASFLAGGEFPYPVPQSGGAGGGATTITIDYKQYGVRLSFMPIVLGNGRIRLHVQPEVSDLDYTHSITLQGFTVPGLTTRTADTTVELSEGQTLSLAGLMDSRVNAVSNITPLLGDLPVLGALFRSVRYERSETELVVLVTPILAGGMNPASVPAVPGEAWRYPNDAQIYVNGDLGGPATDKTHAPPPAPPRQFQGAYGFVPAPPGN